MKKRLVILIAALTTAASANVSVTEPALYGVWEYEKSVLIGGAALYTSLDADSRCTQVAKGRAFGMTKWAVYGCTWSVENGVLKITIIDAPDQPSATGKTNVFTVLAADSERLLLGSKGEQIQWKAVASLPSEFQQKLDDHGLGAPSASPPDADAPVSRSVADQ